MLKYQIAFLLLILSLPFSLYALPSVPLPSGGTYNVNFEFTISANYAPVNLDDDSLLDWVAVSAASGNKFGMVALEARSYNGTLLWQFNTGIDLTNSMDADGEHEATTAWDFDETDPWDEVVVAGFKNGLRTVFMIDGKTGIVQKEVAYPEGYSGDPNNQQRHHACIAYFNNKPHAIICQGVYNGGKVVAYDGNLNLVWTYNHPYSWIGSSAHEIGRYDIDGDGNDEILFGATILNSDGTALFSLSQKYNVGHADMMAAGDFLPGNNKTECYFCIEQGGIAVMTDQSGNELWKVNDPGGHCHNAWVAETDPASPGAEVAAISRVHEMGYQPGNPNDLFHTFSANGTYLYQPKSIGCPVEWTGDDTYDFNVVNKRTENYPFGADVGGGNMHGAEEIVRGRGMNKIQVDFNVSAKSYPSRWENRSYRQDVMRNLSGYAHFESNPRVQGPTIPVVDTTVPTVMSVSSSATNQIVIVFSETIEKTTAENENNYTIDNAIGIPQLATHSSGNRVTLTVPPLTSNQNYTITIQNIEDLAGNKMNQTSKQFIYIASFIENIWVASGKNYASLNLNSGDSLYLDRSYLLGSLPPKYEGLTWIRTAMDDKFSTQNPFLTYSVTSVATVYVGISTLVPTPAWVTANGWNANADTIVVNILGDDIHYTLFAKGFPQPGPVALGANEDPGSNQMYIVLNRPSLDQPVKNEIPLSAMDASSIIFSPNPFRSQINIQFPSDWLNGSQVVVADLRGNIVKTIFGMTHSSIGNGLTWNGRDESGGIRPSGIYLLQATIRNQTLTQKILLLR